MASGADDGDGLARHLIGLKKGQEWVPHGRPLVATAPGSGSLAHFLAAPACGEMEKTRNRP